MPELQSVAETSIDALIFLSHLAVTLRIKKGELFKRSKD